MLACTMEPGGTQRAIASQQGASLGVFDLATARQASKVP